MVSLVHSHRRASAASKSFSSYLVPFSFAFSISFLDFPAQLALSMACGIWRGRGLATIADEAMRYLGNRSSYDDRSSPDTQEDDSTVVEPDQGNGENCRQRIVATATTREWRGRWLIF